MATTADRPISAGVAVEVEGLVRRFGDFTAVNDVSFSVDKGELFGFLGPNGAGKTTTISILCTLLRPSGGVARVAGFDVATERDRVRSNIGLVFQEITLDDYLTAAENLRFHAVMYGVPSNEIEPRMAPLLEMVGLTDRRDQLVQQFSGGMKRRLEIARGLLHTPKVLFLDEPTIGLDPQTRLHIWDYVDELRRREQTTMFLTTHYMDEAERCDRIAIIDGGQIVAIDTPNALKASVGADTVTLATADDELAATQIFERLHVQPVRERDQLVIKIADGEEFVPKVFAAIDVRVRSVNVRRPSLDDVFIKYTGHDMRDTDQQGSLAAANPVARGAPKPLSRGMAIDTAPPPGTGADRARVDRQRPLVRNLRTIGTVAFRELIRLRRMPTRIVSGLAQPVLFLLVLGAGLQHLVGKEGISGVSYQQYIFPGILAMSVITSALFSAIAIVWDREFGFMREMLVAPVSRSSLVLGKALGGGSVAVAQGTILIVLAPVVGVDLTVAKVLGLLCALILLAFAMTALGIVLASRMRRMESFQMVMALVLQPMIFLSGAIFPLNRLPGWLAIPCRLNPATYGVDLARRSLLGEQVALTIGDHVVPIWADIAIVLAVGSVLIAIATRFFGQVE